MASTPTDEELMLAAGRGDLAAFEQLVEKHRARAWRIAWGYIGDQTEAEDIVQAAFLKIFLAAPQYRPLARFTTYLSRVVTRLCLDHAEKRAPVYTAHLDQVPADHPAPGDRMLLDEATEVVGRALDGLPPTQRLAIILRYYEGQGYAEIGEALSLTDKAVERLLARARRNLRPFLGPLNED